MRCSDEVLIAEIQSGIWYIYDISICGTYTWEYVHLISGNTEITYVFSDQKDYPKCSLYGEPYSHAWVILFTANWNKYARGGNSTQTADSVFLTEPSKVLNGYKNMN